MAFSEGLLTHSRPVAADMSAKQYRFVKWNSSSQAALCGTGGEATGIIQDDPDTIGKAGCIGTEGWSKLELGGTVNAGDNVASDSVGRGVAAVSGDFVNARCIIGGVSGDIATVEITAERGRF